MVYSIVEFIIGSLLTLNFQLQFDIILAMSQFYYNCFALLLQSVYNLLHTNDIICLRRKTIQIILRFVG